MNILLTKPYTSSSQRMSAVFPLSLIYLGSYFKRKDPASDVRIFDPDISDFNNENDFFQSIIKLKPDVIGVSIFSHSVKDTQKFFSHLKRELPGTIFVGGGYHINAVRGEAFLQLPFFDFFIHGEGEISFYELCSRLSRGAPSFRSIEGLIYKENGDIKVNNNGFSENIDLFDPLDFSLIDPKKYFSGSPSGLFHKGDQVLQIITTRGCPYLCTYCASPINMGRKLRKRSVQNIINELIELKEKGANEINILDDNFTFDKKHAIAVCKNIIRNDLRMHFSLPNGARLDKLDDEMLDCMKKAGFYHIGFGIEVGSDKSLKKIKKNLNYSLIKEKIKIVKKYGIGTTGFFIIGLPFETVEDIQATGNAPDMLGLDLASFGNFTPHPGTELYKELVKSKEIPKDYLPSFATGKITYSPRGISKRKLEALQRQITIRYYLNPKRIIFILKRLHLKDLKFVFRRMYQIICRPSAG